MPVKSPISGMISVNGASLYYEQKGEGRAIVFIHGFSLDHRMWDDQFDYFAQRHRVLRYDLRGFGHSDLPDGTPYAHHTDLRALIDRLEIDEAILVGLSMGGRVAIDFTLAFPERVTGLIPVDTVIQGYRYKDFDTDYIIKKAEESPEEAVRLWLAHALFAPAREKKAVRERLYEIVLPYGAWHWTHDNPWTPLSPAAIHQVEKIRKPTLIVVGENDLEDFHIMANLLEEKIDGAKKIIVPDAGHMSNMEQPELFNKILEDYLNKIYNAGN